ncbi:TerB N-terminal domain-containing protein [Rahnella sp. PCH160]|uniref:tellurite resistance TerB family protein n=1 Tax=Rahnella sp. PCH160 TaxID=3447928 RepID=UPI0039FC87CF
MQTRVISRGNFYYGEELINFPSHHYYSDDGNDASLVNGSLLTSFAPENYQDETLSYWPRYASLSPGCRGAYLNWLASERSEASCPIGYIFIYFYGLERRILLDGKQGIVADDEFRQIFDEVYRLRNIFKDNYSFRNYSARLIDVMLFLRPEVVSIPEASGFILTNESLSFRFQLAKTVEEGLPIAEAMALAWVIYYPLYTLRTPARRCESEFSALFKKRYTQKFGASLIVKPNKTRLKLEYTPPITHSGHCSRTTRSQRPEYVEDPLQKLIQIAETATDELEAYSRYLGKKDTSKNDIAAMVLLPEEILSEDNKKLMTHFKSWADERIHEHNGLVPLSAFWECLGISSPEKINKKETELMQGFTGKAGFGYAPDSRYHYAKPEPDGNIVLFACEPGENLIPSSGFASVSVALRLGAQMAQADSDIDESERGLLQRIIDNNHTLSAVEKRSLHAYLVWRLNMQANVAGLKARIDQISVQERASIGEIIVSVACADGKITPTEIRQLEKIYTHLGLDSNAVTRDIHHFSTSSKMSSSASDGSKSPESFSLDKNILARHESETKDVQNLLNAIFEGEQPEEPVKTSLPVSQPVLTNLDQAHRTFYEHLLQQDAWAREAATEICKGLGLMLSGAVETINDWSYERVDAPVLEDNDQIYVDLEIAQELKG